MNKVLRIVGFVVAGLIGLPLLAVMSVAGASRFADGPLVELLPGGPLVSGEWVTEEPDDWGFVADESTIEFESDGRSRKVYILTIDGAAYIPASLGFPPFKKWHERALEDPAAVVRIGGKRYARNLVKVDDAELEARLGQQSLEKYGGVPDGGAGAWFFRLDRPLDGAQDGAFNDSADPAANMEPGVGGQGEYRSLG
jgi:hypothetical protein